MIAVIGCGNSNRSDDGVGPAVVRGLVERGIDNRGVKLLDAGTDGMAVMFAARGCTTLIVIDACRSGSDPGTVFELPGAEVERDHVPSLNLHDFRWDHALAAGRRIFGAAFPSDVTVFLIEAASIDFGFDLSPPVAAAVAKVVDRIARRLLAPAEAAA
jgi:hydrogenase maturation protease